MKDNFDIFVGGPMGDMADDGAGTPLADHIANIVEAISELEPELEEASPGFRFLTHSPEVDEFGSIPNTVFTMINYSELGILDLSAQSPSVMYELTLFHALGTPIIPLHLRSKVNPSRLPFYLRQDYATLVDDYSTQTLVEALRPKLLAAVSAEAFGVDRSSNPLTDFYGMPLVDASATTGLATGYYHNFLQHVIRQTDSVFTKNDDLKEIVILVPGTLDETASMRDPLERRIRELGLELQLVGSKDGKVYEDREQVRGQMVLFRAGPYIFDTPAPLLAQKSSPMHLRLAKMLSKARGERRDQVRNLFERRQKAMIEGFFSAIANLVNGPNSDRSRVRFSTISEFLELLREHIRSESDGDEAAADT